MTANLLDYGTRRVLTLHEPANGPTPRHKYTLSYYCSTRTQASPYMQIGMTSNLLDYGTWQKLVWAFKWIDIVHEQFSKWDAAL